MESYQKEKYEEAIAAFDARYPWTLSAPWPRWLERIKEYVRSLEEENVALHAHTARLAQENQESRDKLKQETKGDE